MSLFGDRRALYFSEKLRKQHIEWAFGLWISQLLEKESYILPLCWPRCEPNFRSIGGALSKWHLPPTVTHSCSIKLWNEDLHNCQWRPLHFVHPSRRGKQHKVFGIFLGVFHRFVVDPDGNEVSWLAMCAGTRKNWMCPVCIRLP